MTGPDWKAGEEANTSSSSPDIFMDEMLLDIYNAAVEDGANPDASHENNEIPTLPPPPPATTSNGAETNPEEQDGNDHPGAMVAATAAAIDGLETFHPESSFSTLSTTVTGDTHSNNQLAQNTAAGTTASDSGQPIDLSAGIKRKLSSSDLSDATKKPAYVVNKTPAAPPPTAMPSTAAVSSHNYATPVGPPAPPAIATAAQGGVSHSVPPNAFVDPATLVATVPVSRQSNVPTVSYQAPAAPSTVPISYAPAAPPCLSALPPAYPQVSTNHALTTPVVPPPTSSALPDTTSAVDATNAPVSQIVANQPSRSASIAKRPSKTSKAKKNASPVVPEPAPSSSSTAPKKNATEADFKSVAQAAVSSLITGSKNGNEAASKIDRTAHPIDTSTAHIKALTGSNWVAACSGVGAAAVAAAAPVTSATATEKNNKNKRQNLTADERARQNRDRNREHARNTRIRKKAYVEELKRTLTELVTQRDNAEVQKRQAAQRDAEQREVRFRVIEEFLKLRARNETNSHSWSAILAPAFTLTVPATDLRELITGHAPSDPAAGGAARLEVVLSGVSETMNESNAFALFLQAIGTGENENEYNPVGFVYNCDRKNFFMDDNNAVLEWSAGSVGLTSRGAEKELFMRGSIRASFCQASNKLLSANLMFDSGAVLSQIQEFMQCGRPTGGAVVVPQGESSDEGH